MLQIREDILTKKTLDTRVIVGLDVSKAFDNVQHTAILKQLSALNVGQKTFNYIKDFLTNRTATISMGGETLDNVKLGSIGTPQGSVLSPTLFNIAMIGLPKMLDKIQGLHHTVYADDLTMWMNRGSDGHIEQTLQRAIDETEKYLERIGLSLSAQKSELIMNTRAKGDRRVPITHIQPKVNGQDIQRVQSIRILGLRIQENGKNNETILMLDKCTENVCRMLKRVSSKQAGMKENNLIRLVQAFVISSHLCSPVPSAHASREE